MTPHRLSRSISSQLSMQCPKAVSQVSSLAVQFCIFMLHSCLHCAPSMVSGSNVPHAVMSNMLIKITVLRKRDRASLPQLAIPHLNGRRTNIVSLHHWQRLVDGLRQ